MLQLAYFSFLFAYALAYPSTIEKYEDIPQQYREIIPEKVAEHLKSITPEERKVLTELVKDYAKYKDEDEFMAALKEKSESLHEKAKKLHDMLKEKIDALGDEAKEFVKKVMSIIPDILFLKLGTREIAKHTWSSELSTFDPFAFFL
ncbi:unnamed protein product [Angiostrongylus costaricensis]|uniref:Fatty-acid and retinol-binding protein 1 n=1 Tax=Angiostrongylus costaricensis TaxID=334426 RepID=A0A0R3PXF9_ANGCS|nr:unnamed protein product [Angiostrongylus costaricensis]